MGYASRRGYQSIRDYPVRQLNITLEEKCTNEVIDTETAYRLINNLLMFEFHELSLLFFSALSAVFLYDNINNNFSHIT